MFDGLLKVLATYVLAVAIAVSPFIVIDLISHAALDEFLRNLRVVILVFSIFMLLPFVLIGLPYMAFGYPGWGRDHPVLFCVVGALLGAVGANATLTIITSQWQLGPIEALGAVVGAGCSWLWHILYRVLNRPIDA